MNDRSISRSHFNSHSESVTLYWFSENWRFAFEGLAWFLDQLDLWLRRSDCGLAVSGGLVGGLTLLFPPFPGGLQLAIALGQDRPVTPLQFGLRRDVADGAVQPHRVVV